MQPQNVGLWQEKEPTRPWKIPILHIEPWTEWVRCDFRKKKKNTRPIWKLNLCKWKIILHVRWWNSKPISHTHIHPASKKTVKMIEKGSLEMKSRTRSENKSTRGADVLVKEKETESREKQQIVVLKMWEKCKNFHFGILLHMQNTHLHLHRVGATYRVVIFFFYSLAICISLLYCFSSVVIVKFPLAAAAAIIDDVPLLLEGLYGFCSLTIAFCSSETAGGWGLYRFHFEWMLCERLSTMARFSGVFFAYLVFSLYLSLSLFAQLKNGKQKIYRGTLLTRSWKKQRKN